MPQDHPQKQRPRTRPRNNVPPMTGTGIKKGNGTSIRGNNNSACLYFNSQITLFLRQGDLRAAEECMKHMAAAGIRRARSSFNAMINAHKVRGDMVEAEQVIRQMLCEGVQPNSVTFTTMISGCAQVGDVEGAEKWFSRMLQVRCEPNEQTHNAMVTVYAQVGDLETADRWLRTLLEDPSKVQPSMVTFNTLIHAYSRAQQFDKAGYWFRELLARGLTPNQSTVSALMTCFIENGDKGMVEYYVENMCSSGLAIPDLSYNTMIKACARRGDAEQAEKVFQHMLKEGHNCSVSTYNAMIHACTQIGDIKRAERYLGLMKGGDVAPDLVTFNTVINACAALGDANRAQHWLLQMIDAKLIPNEVTYGTICKAYARQGKPNAVKCVIDALEAAGFRLNEYFYASWISAFGAATPPDPSGAEMAFALMLTRGLKAHSVKRVLVRVVGERRAGHLIDFSKRKVVSTDIEYNSDDGFYRNRDNGKKPKDSDNSLPLAAHQQISEKLRKFMGMSGMLQLNESATAPTRGEQPVSGIPLPLFLSKGKPPPTQPGKLTSFKEVTDVHFKADDKSQVSFDELLHRVAKENQFIIADPEDDDWTFEEQQKGLQEFEEAGDHFDSQEQPGGGQSGNRWLASMLNQIQTGKVAVSTVKSDEDTAELDTAEPGLAKPPRFEF